MIIAILGTKGQFIKMAPIFLELEKRGHDYLFINAKQHVQSLEKMIDIFGTKKPDIEFWHYKEDITNVKQIIKWLFINTLQYSIGKKRKIFKFSGRNLILIHGDAPPVLLGVILSKFHKIDLAHIEAGLRSRNILSPFPEELIRIYADRKSTILFPLSDFALRNLKRRRKQIIFPIKRNTVYDSIKFTSKKSVESSKRNYVVYSIHRFETLISKSKLEFITELLLEISKTEKVIFPMHESTRRALIKNNLLKKFEDNESIEITPLFDYINFISLLKYSKYIVTDGGGPQEESHYLGVPCLVLRENTERKIWKNVYHVNFNFEKAISFTKNFKKYRLAEFDDKYSPSKEIVDILEKLGYTD